MSHEARSGKGDSLDQEALGLLYDMHHFQAEGMDNANAFAVARRMNEIGRADEDHFFEILDRAREWSPRDFK